MADQFPDAERHLSSTTIPPPSGDSKAIWSGRVDGSPETRAWLLVSEVWGPLSVQLALVVLVLAEVIVTFASTTYRPPIRPAPMTW